MRGERARQGGGGTGGARGETREGDWQVAIATHDRKSIPLLVCDDVR